MQRKNYLLIPRKSRPAIAMITAIGMLIVVSTLLALSISLSTQTTKRTSDLYLYEQAVLLSKSSAEYALLQIAKSNPCSVTSNSLDFTHNTIYDVNITFQYVYRDATTCNNGGADSYFTVATDEQNGSILMDITVTVDNENVVSEPIRYFRRSIQKL
jgi:type II secretory pathway pseudopilin PulG